MPVICWPGRFLTRPRAKGCCVRNDAICNRRRLRRAGRRPITEQWARHQGRIVIDSIRSIRRNIFRTFCWRSRLFTGDAGRGCIAGVLGLQTLLESLISSGGLGRSCASRQERETEQTESNFNFHGAENSIQLRVYNYYNPTINGKTFFHPPVNRLKIGPSFSMVALGHSFRSVIRAASRAECSGQAGSAGIRGMASTRTFLAVSALAVR